jgi:hypothetical protein
MDLYNFSFDFPCFSFLSLSRLIGWVDPCQVSPNDMIDHRTSNSKSICYIVLSHLPPSGRPEPNVTWINGVESIQTGGGVSMGRHVTVNRLEIPQITRKAMNHTYKCQASNTQLVPPAERSVRVEMLCKWENNLKIGKLNIEWHFLCVLSLPSETNIDDNIGETEAGDIQCTDKSHMQCRWFRS